MRAILLTLIIMVNMAAGSEAGLDLSWLGGSLPGCGQGRGFLLPGLFLRFDLWRQLSTEWSVGYWSWTPQEGPPQQDPFGDEYRDHGARLGQARAGVRFRQGSLFASAGMAILQEREFWTERSNLGGGWYAWIRYYRRDTFTGPYLSAGWRRPLGSLDFEVSLTGVLYSMKKGRAVITAGIRL